ncbi:hypothetical protein D3C78_1715280 [compost metagenome]
MHHAFDVMGIDKPQVTLVQHTVAFDEYPVRAVDQNLRHRVIAQQHLQRTETGEFVDDLFG